ncbi:9321_t:CDS:1, partial [Racocetra persica]
INTYYQQVFETKTEYSSLATMGFENEVIIQHLIADIVFFLIFLCIENLNVTVSSIRDLDENRILGVGTGFVFSFVTCYHKELHLFVLKIEKYQCVLEIYLDLDLKCINTITGTDPDQIWNQVEILKKYIRLYLFEIRNPLVQNHINILRNELSTCAVNEWTTNKQQLEKVFNRHIKSRKMKLSKTDFE